ncbi:MAG: acyltransferase [Bacilli bacterium]|nr:acyltransferase [Bacilli bacterium]
MEEKVEKKREIFIDFFRAICILFVLLGHRTILPDNIGIFVLPGFFIASGYTFRPSKDNFKTFFVKKLKRLMVPFWIAMGIYVGIEIARGYIFGYGNWQFLFPGLLGATYGSFVNLPSIGEFGKFIAECLPQKTQTPGYLDIILSMSCHLWFLPALFSADILLYFYFKYRPDRVWLDILAVLGFLLLCGIETIPGMIQLPVGLGRGFYAAACMIAGYYMKKTELFTSKRLPWQITLLILAIIPSVVSVVYPGYAGRGFVRSSYGEPMFLGVIVTYICGLSFSYIVMYASYWLSKIKDNPISRMFAFVGANSMDIYLWHFLAFFITDLFMVLVLKAPTHFDKFYMEMFDGTETLYRVISVIITYAALGLYSYIKIKVKSNIKAKKLQAAQ